METRKEYYERNKAAFIAATKRYKEKNKDKAKAWDKVTKSKPERKEYDKNYQQEYYKNNDRREYQKQYRANRKLNDPLFKLTLTIRSLISKSLSTKGYTKNSKVFDILGCSYDEFKTYLESLFEEWMTWDNYGKYEKDKFNVGWDIDHVIPLAESKTEEEIIKLNHYTNLQPLCSKTNRDVKKGKL